MVSYHVLFSRKSAANAFEPELRFSYEEMVSMGQIFRKGSIVHHALWLHLRHNFVGIHYPRKAVVARRGRVWYAVMAKLHFERTLTTSARSPLGGMA